jgi:hypothetical protein
MKEKQPTLKQQLEALAQWDEQPHLGENDHWYFYDWSKLKRRSLANRSRVLFTRLKTFLAHIDIDLEKTYVFFKNNCPMSGPPYDDFRICDLETGDVLYTVRPTRQRTSPDIWGSRNGFTEPLVSSEGGGPRSYPAVIKELAKQLTAEVTHA